MKNVIFVHIPKAAGSTLRSVLRRQYSSRQRHAITTSPSVKESLAEFHNLPQSKREGLRCVMGHGTFGLHSLLSGSTHYITMLRDPVDRVISNYYYIRRSPQHRLYSDVVEREMSLKEYVGSGVNSALDNQMTRQIAGVNSGGYTNKTLQKAKGHLDKHFAVVGLVEHFDDSLLLMKRHFGWGDVSYYRRNATHDRPGRESMSEEVIEKIRQHNRLDEKLYTYAEQRLKQRLERVDLSTEKRKLRLGCWLRSSKSRLKESVKQGLTAVGVN